MRAVGKKQSSVRKWAVLGGGRRRTRYYIQRSGYTQLGEKRRWEQTHEEGEGVKKPDVWGGDSASRETARAKARGRGVPAPLQEQHRGRCAWSKGRKGKSQTERREVPDLHSVRTGTLAGL